MGLVSFEMWNKTYEHSKIPEKMKQIDQDEKVLNDVFLNGGVPNFGKKGVGKCQISWTKRDTGDYDIWMQEHGKLRSCIATVDPKTKKLQINEYRAYELPGKAAIIFSLKDKADSANSAKWAVHIDYRHSNGVHEKALFQEGKAVARELYVNLPGGKRLSGYLNEYDILSGCVHFFYGNKDDRQAVMMEDKNGRIIMNYDQLYDYLAAKKNPVQQHAAQLQEKQGEEQLAPEAAKNLLDSGIAKLSQAMLSAEAATKALFPGTDTNGSVDALHYASNAYAGCQCGIDALEKLSQALTQIKTSQNLDEKESFYVGLRNRLDKWIEGMRQEVCNQRKFFVQCDQKDTLDFVKKMWKRWDPVDLIKTYNALQGKLDKMLDQVEIEKTQLKQQQLEQKKKIAGIKKALQPDNTQTNPKTEVKKGGIKQSSVTKFAKTQVGTKPASHQDDSDQSHMNNVKAKTIVQTHAATTTVVQPNGLAKTVVQPNGKAKDVVQPNVPAKTLVQPPVKGKVLVAKVNK